MNIKPGQFIRHDSLSISFEVQEVFSDMCVCASRDPKFKTELVFLKDIYECVDTPLDSHWVKLDRSKGFYDKFHPEGWQPYKSKVIPFSAIEAGMELVGTKGVLYPVSKKGNTWKCTGSQKSITSKNNDTYVWQVIQHEKYTGV